MAMKKCKECGEEVSSSAKQCPKCGKDQRNFFQKHPVICVILIICVFGIALSGGDDTAPVATNSSSTTQETIFNIGDTIQNDGYEVIIENVGEATKVGTTYLSKQPSEGGVFVTVDWKIKNSSTAPMSSFDLPTIKLVDGNGVSYDTDLDASSYYATEKDPDRNIFSDLNPGITVKDNDVFEISTDSYSQGEWFVLIDNEIKIKIK